MYKLLAKILARRLLVIGGLISTSEHAFVGSRQILDAILIASEAVDARLKEGVTELFANLIWRRLMTMLIRSFFSLCLGRLVLGSVNHLSIASLRLLLQF